MLQAVFLLAAAVVFLLSQADHFVALIPWVLADAIVDSPIIPLLDSNALEVANQHQGCYGGLRHIVSERTPLGMHASAQAIYSTVAFDSLRLPDQ